MLPPTIQTTNQFSSEFPGIIKKDTRPAFLGGKYKSKVQGVSEVSQYINHARTNTETYGDDNNNQNDADFGVQSYYKAKLRMRNSLERAFNTQAKQVINEVKSKNIGSNKAFVTMPTQERD